MTNTTTANEESESGGLRRSSAAHTPGPWTIQHVRDDLRIYGNCEGGCIATVQRASNIAQTEADCHLIAAAPSMLEALRKVETLANIELRDRPNTSEDELRALLQVAGNAARSAIAQATGVQS